MARGRSSDIIVPNADEVRRYSVRWLCSWLGFVFPARLLAGCITIQRPASVVATIHGIPMNVASFGGKGRSAAK